MSEELSGRFMTMQEVADVLGTTLRHVRQLTLHNNLAYYKFGKLIRIHSHDLEAWVDARRHVLHNLRGKE